MAFLVLHMYKRWYYINDLTTILHNTPVLACHSTTRPNVAVGSARLESTLFADINFF